MQKEALFEDAVHLDGPDPNPNIHKGYKFPNRQSETRLSASAVVVVRACRGGTMAVSTNTCEHSLTVHCDKITGFEVRSSS